MFWLWARLPAIVSMLTCLVFLGSLPPLELFPNGAMPSPKALPALATVRARISVSVVNCESDLRRVVKPAKVRVYQWLKDHYPQVAEAELTASRSVQFDVKIGGYWVVTSMPGCARDVQWLSVNSVSPLELKVGLLPVEPLRVLVRNEDKVPIARAVVLGWGEEPLAHGAETASNGIAYLLETGSDVDRIVVRAQGYESVEVEPQEGGVDVVLRQLGGLEVMVRNSEAEAVSGATVRIAGFSFAAAQEVLTDPQGIAFIRGLERGSYDVRAHADELVSRSRLGVVLGRGQNRKITLVLEKGRFVSVRVVDSAQAEAEPVSNAEVVLVEDGLGPFPLHGRTDERGQVQLGPLPFSAAVLNVWADGFVARSGIEVPRDLSGIQTVRLLQGGVLSGRVVNSAGVPVAGASIEVVGNDVFGRPIAARAGNVAVRRGFFEQASPGGLPLAPVGQLGVMLGGLPTPAGQIRARVQTSWVSDEMGTFRLPDVPPGRLRVLVEHPDYVSVLSSATSLAPGGTAQLRVLLPLGGNVRGTVLTADGQAVEAARVDAVAQRGSDHQTTLTDELGQFEFADVPRLVQLSVARPEDPHRFVIKHRLETEPGETQSVSLVLPPLRGPCEISVSGPNGEVVDDARVSLLSLDPEVPLRQSLFVDSSGRVVMDDAVGLEVQIKVRSLRFRAMAIRLDSLPEVFSVQLERGGSISGEVSHVRGRQALAGARVQWTQGAATQQVLTDDAGAYRFDDVGPGRGTLTISLDGFSAISELIELTAEQLEQTDAFELPSVNLMEGGSVSGVIVDSRERPVSNARVGRGLIPAFLPVGSSPAGFVQTDAQGRFLLTGLPEGALSLSAYAVDVGRGRVESIVVEAGSVTEDVTIQLGGSHPDTEPGALGNAAVTLGERRVPGGAEVVVVHVAEGSEAAMAGIEVGDIITEVEGVPSTGLAQTRSQLGGPEGSDVVVGLRRDGEQFRVRMRREAVRR